MDSSSLGKGIEDGGGYDLDEIRKATEALDGNKDIPKDMEDVEPMYIEVIPHDTVHHTEQYEARIVIVDYDENNNIIGVELL